MGPQGVGGTRKTAQSELRGFSHIGASEIQ
nr:MAG TPA: hypothetical protein [Caudoviricetes sp.]